MLKQIYENLKKYNDGTYIAVSPTQETKEKLKLYIENVLPNLECLSLNDLHVTLIYSKKPLEKEVKLTNNKYTGIFRNFSIFGDEDECLVLEFDSPELQTRNKELTELYGFISDFPSYKTHITLSVEAKGFNPAELPPINFELEFENEYIEPLNLDWKSNLE